MHRKKLAYGKLVLDTFSNRYVLLSDSVCFYDMDYNLLHKEPKLRSFYNVQILGDNKYLFSSQLALSCKTILYDFTKREIVEDIKIKNKNFPAICGGLKTKSRNIIFNGEFILDKTNDKWEYVLAFYNQDTREYKIILNKTELFNLCFEYENKYYFASSCKLVVFDENLNVNELPITGGGGLYQLRFDPIQAKVVFVNCNDNDKQYYGHEDTNLCYDLNGKISSWTPPKNPYESENQKIELKRDNQVYKEIMKNTEGYITKNGLTKEVFECVDSEGILHGGFIWACEKLESIAKEKGYRYADDLFADEKFAKEKVFTPESVLYQVGMFYEEILNGGLSRYIFNDKGGGRRKMLKDILIKVNAGEAANIINKTIAAISDEHETDDYINFAKKTDKIFEKYEDQLAGEDYISKTVEYIKAHV